MVKCHNNIFSPHNAILVNREIGYSGVRLIFARMQYSMMLNRRNHDNFCIRGGYSETFNCPVVTFRSTGGEKNIIWICVNALCNSLSRFFYCMRGFFAKEIGL